jgi:cysteine desulfurase/selenocysteine lyase
MFDEAREKVRRFFNASNYVLGFTSGTTGTSNFIATRFPFKKGDTLVITEMEHNSQVLTARNYATRAGAKVVYVPVTSEEGRLDLEALRKIISRVKRGRLLVNLIHVSNFSGVVNPVEEVRRIVGDRGYIYLDMAQSAGRMPIDLDALDVDFAGVSAHKMYGPMGIGAVLINDRSQRLLTDAVSGGSAIDMISKWFIVPAETPDRYEPGTQDLEGAIEWGYAIDYIEKIGREAIEAHEGELCSYFLDELNKIDSVHVYGPKGMEARSAVVSFNIGPPDKKTYDKVARQLDQRGIAVRDGCLCAHIYAAKMLGLPGPAFEARAAMRKAGVPNEVIKFLGAVRASFALYNGLEDAHRAITAIREIASRFEDASA